MHGVGGQCQQVHPAALQWALRVQAGEQQQVVDQQAHPAGFAFDARHQHLDVLGRTLPVQLRESADRGQRGAQLVAGVGDEPAHPFLGHAGVVGRGLRRRHRALDLGEHAVERQRQPADLGARITFGHTAIQLAGGDRRGRPLDLHQGTQAAVHHPVPDHAQDHQHGRADGHL